MKDNTNDRNKNYSNPSSISKKPILIIHGAFRTKIGLGGEKYPRFVLPEPSSSPLERIQQFPLNGAIPTDEKKLKNAWRVILQKLDLSINDRPILLSLPTANLSDCPFKELAQQFFFYELGASKVAVVSDPFLGMLGYMPRIKSYHGLIVDIGFSKIRIVPIFDLTTLEDHVAQFDFGGYFLTVQLGKWLKNQNYDGPVDANFIREIKETFCRVKSLSEIKKEKNESPPITYTLNDKNFTLQSEIWKLPELFFHADFFSKKIDTCPRSNCDGENFDLSKLTLSKAINNVIKSLNFSIWEKMFNNICLIGGGVKFDGLAERLLEELTILNPAMKNKITIHQTKHTDLMSYLGASKLSVLPSFQKYWRTKEDFETNLYEVFL